MRHFNDQSQNPLPRPARRTWAELKAAGIIGQSTSRQWHPTKEERLDARREELDAGFDDSLQDPA